jgi:TetR/AcrR family transcriptional repressor of bet genes
MQDNRVVQLPASRKASKEVRRQQLIEATIDTLARRGYAATTLGDVARVAGLSGGIVNFHFESKDKLFIETLRTLAQEYSTNWRSALAMAGDRPADRLHALLAADFNDVVCTPRKLAAWCAFWAEAQNRPVYLDHCSANDEDYQQTITAICRDIIAQGGYPYDPHRIARGLEAMMEGIWLDLMTMQSPISREEGLKTVLASLGAFFPKHFSPEGEVLA